MADTHDRGPLPAELADWLARHADSLDTSAALAADVVPRLAAAGLFGIGVPAALGGAGGSVRDAIGAIAAVAERSLTAAFVFWGHRTFIEYLLQSPNAAPRARWLPALLRGEIAGATGLSNAMKYLSGIEGLHIAATPDEAGWRLDGALAWVTNLRPQGFVAAAAVTMGEGAPAVVAFAHDAPGVVRSADLDLLGLRGSHTAALRLERVRIDAADVLADDARTWLPAVRPAFLGMQCGMSIGLARASLAAAERLGAGRPGALADSVATLRAVLEGHVAALLDGVDDGRFQAQAAPLFRLRLALADAVQQAAMLELQASGGAAYLLDRDPAFARRWREAAFVPIVTPSLTQLRAALAGA